MPSENSKTAKQYVESLDLEPHPEGGYYKETYRSEVEISAPGFDGLRNISTGIYYLLEKGSFSAFHRIKSDEMWHFYDGACLSVYMIDEKGEMDILRLGRNIDKGETLQAVVPAGRWFASRVEVAGFALVGCTVSPGFDFKDFEMASREELMDAYPAHAEIIKSLTR